MNFLTSFNVTQMNYIDWLILTVTALSILYGTYRGFVASIIGLIGWVCSVLVTYKYGGTVKAFLISRVQSEMAQIMISYVGLMLTSLVGFAILNAFLYSLVRPIQGHFIDRILGFFFGLCRGILICSFCFFVMDFIVDALGSGSKKNDHNEEIHSEKTVRDAQFYPLIQSGVEVIYYLTKNINLEATINEDDGKVEVTPSHGRALPKK